MRNRWSGMTCMLAAVLLLATVLASGCVTVEEEPDYFVGNWEGAMNTPVGSLPMVFHISQDEQGLTCVLDTDLSNIQIPCGAIEATEDSIHIAVPQVQASYLGTLDAGQLSGQWSQAGLDFHLTLSRLD